MKVTAAPSKMVLRKVESDTDSGTESDDEDSNWGYDTVKGRKVSKTSKVRVKCIMAPFAFFT